MSRRSDSGLDGILLVDKPSGWTSHDVVAKARGLTGQRRIGHTGTLDPMATGLLVLCLGQATRLVEYLIGHDKRYTGTLALGATTDTDDAEGEVLSSRPVPLLDQAAIAAVADRFRGELLQRPPAFSALKVAGERAYRAARRGDLRDLPARPVTVRALTLSAAGPASLDLDVTCSAGFYVRSLARDIGEALGCGGHLSALRRRRSGPFDVASAVTLAGLEEAAARDAVSELLLPPDEGILGLSAAIIGSAASAAIANGRTWTTTCMVPRAGAKVRIYSAAGEFVGVGLATSSGDIRANKVFLRGKSGK